MSKKAFTAILAGLDDAVRHAKGNRRAAKSRRVEVREVDVAALRETLGLTQEQFAKAFGVTAATLRNWEQGRREPRGPARVLLNVIEKEPEAVLRALLAG